MTAASTATASMPWTRQKDGRILCARHGEYFKPPASTCQGCKADKGTAPIGEAAKVALPRPPKGCRSSTQHEAFFTKLSNDALADAERLLVLARALTTPKPVEGAGEVVYVAPDHDPGGGAPTHTATFNFHLEGKADQHRQTAIKAARAAAQLAQIREDEHLVAEREKRLRKPKERSH